MMFKVVPATTVTMVLVAAPCHTIPCCAMLCCAVLYRAGAFDSDSGGMPRSYAGTLMPIQSMPIGQIPHAFVIPFAELTLQELIGSGAEGKVSVNV